MRDPGGHEAVPHLVREPPFFAEYHCLEYGRACPGGRSMECLMYPLAPVLNGPEYALAAKHEFDVAGVLEGSGPIDPLRGEVRGIVERSGIFESPRPVEAAGEADGIAEAQARPSLSVAPPPPSSTPSPPQLPPHHN